MKKVKISQDPFHCPKCGEELDALECLIVSDTGKCTECCKKLVREKACKEIQSRTCLKREIKINYKQEHLKRVEEILRLTEKLGKLSKELLKKIKEDNELFQKERKTKNE